MPKFPWMQFNTGDWLKDPKLSMCLPATRGIWIDAIAAMHEDRRSGTLSGSLCQLARVLRCTEPALIAALDDLQATGAGDVTQRNGCITLINRRMFREAKDRENNRLRQERFRYGPDDNGGITPLSPSDVVSLKGLFVRFWEAYPRHEAKQNAWKSFLKLQPGEELLGVMISWLGAACKSEQWQDKTKIPHPATWLNQRRWEDDPPPMPKPVKKSLLYHPDTVGANNDESCGYEGMAAEIRKKPPETWTETEREIVRAMEASAAGH